MSANYLVSNMFFLFLTLDQEYHAVNRTPNECTENNELSSSNVLNKFEVKLLIRLKIQLSLSIVNHYLGSSYELLVSSGCFVVVLLEIHHDLSMYHLSETGEPETTVSPYCRSSGMCTTESIRE